jgi:excisionase family DNA binding protein
MSLLSITEAAHAAGVSRRTIQRSIQSGRLSAATTATGERAIDTTELLRVFGPLRQAPSDTPASMSQPVATNDAPDDTLTVLVEVLRDQLQQAQQEKARLLAMLEAEQQARRELETKLLPAPRPAQTGKVRAWALVGLLVVVAFAGWWFRAAILAALA